MTFGTPVGEKEAVDLVHHALDQGINFIDTANMYEGYARYIGSAGGVAEKFVGRAIQGKRSSYIVATKVGMKVGEAAEDEGTSPEAISKHLDLSLGRLKTDYVDIYYLHKPDPDVEAVRIAEALAKCIESGKIKHYGVSNYSADQLESFLKAADNAGLPRPVIIQPPLSLLKQDVLADLLPLCQREEVAAAPYQILQGGVLTGKYSRGNPLPEGSRVSEKKEWAVPLTDELFDQLDTIQAEADQAGMSMTQYAINWTLKQPSVVSAIVGVKRPEQIDEAVAAVRNA
jgi:aryl-alcohol dehydrogenase-like predicted oxidoreductase